MMIPFGAVCADAISEAWSNGASTQRVGGTDSTCTALYEELAWAEDEGKNESPQGFACGGPEKSLPAAAQKMSRSAGILIV